LAAFALILAACRAEPPRPGIAPGGRAPPSTPAPTPSLLLPADDAGQTPPAPTQPPEIFSYGLGTPERDCDVDRMIARLGRCHRVAGSSEYPALADGNACRGAVVPADEEASVFFDGPRVLSGVVVIAGTVREPEALRLLALKLRSDRWVTHTRLPRPLFEQRAFAGVFVEEREIDAHALALERVGAETEWLEIAPFRCEGDVKSPTDPPRKRRIVVGAGFCRSDSDCVPASCCHAKSCVSRAMAPACFGVSCPQDCVPETLDCGGACLCIHNRCAAGF
jgi:hypothetical protein